MPGKAQLAADAWRLLGNGCGLSAPLRWRGLLVLNYHRVGDWDASPLDRGVYSASSAGFAEQMATLARGFEVISLEELPDARRDPRGRYVMVTFDDGYRDNYDLAFPILKRERIPAVFFITTGFIDDAPVSWWDRIAWMIREAGQRGLRELPGSRWWGAPLPLAHAASSELAIWTVLSAYKQTPSAQTPDLMAELASVTGLEAPVELGQDLWMTWDQIREVRAAGMSIGGHTHTHPLLARLGPAEQAEEINRCKERLLAAAGVQTRGFAYPVGARDAFDATTKTALLANGFDLAFSFYGGYQSMAALDPLDIRRAAVARHTTPKLFAAMATLPRVFAR